MSRDDTADEQKRDDLIYDLVKNRYEDEISRRDKLDEQARSLVSSILVGIGFLLAARTTSLIDKESPVSYVYPVGVGILLSSITIAFIVLRVKVWLYGVNVDYLLKEYTSKRYEIVLQRTAATMVDSLRFSQEANNQKARLLMTSIC